MKYKAGFVGLVGLPNAGKSSLLNQLVKEKVSIVSSKPQTTRKRVLGIETFSHGQVIFVDSPGIIKNGRGLNAFLEQEAQSVIQESDILVAVIGIDENHKENIDEIIQMVSNSGKPWSYVITKIDLENYSHRKQILIESIKESHPEVLGFSFSQLWTSELEAFRADFFKWIFSVLPPSVGPLFDEDIYTTQSIRDLVAEIIREKCFEELSHELPYQLAVRIVSFEEKDKFARIEADILIGKDSHKSIIIGAKGSKIKLIGTKARSDIEKILGYSCYLGLNVVVRENWTNNRLIMKELGYVINSQKS